jgi:hypothetical protein
VALACTRGHATLPLHQRMTTAGAEVRAAVNTPDRSVWEDGWTRIDRPDIVPVDVQSLESRTRNEVEDFDGWGVREVDWRKSVAGCGERDPERNITTPCEREWNGKVRVHKHPDGCQRFGRASERAARMGPWKRYSN